MATPGIDDVGGPKASEISELHRSAKWRVPPEEIEEEDDLLTGELKLFQSVAARFSFLAMDRSDLLYSVKRNDAKNGLTGRLRSHCPQKSSPLHNQIFPNGLQICVDSIGQ